MPQPVIQWRDNRQSETWLPTTLDKLGRSEEFLESVLAESPELMRLQSRRTGINGTYRVFRQLALPTPTGRTIYPDIVLLSSSGHVIVVEVKRGSNSELSDRSVIAQIVDYASSFAALSDEELPSVFGVSSNEPEAWFDFIQSIFPEETDTEELASVLRQKLEAGEIHLVIACDRMPPRLPDLVKGVSSQSALGFSLDVIEVVPHVRQGSDESEILFVPTSRVETEIVARTAISITYQQGDVRPSLEIQTTSVEEIEENISAAKSGQRGRIWTDAEVEQAIREVGDPTEVRLLEFAKKHSADGQFVTPGEKINAGIGFYVRGTDSAGKAFKSLTFSCTQGWNCIYIYFNRLDELGEKAAVAEFRNSLAERWPEAGDKSRQQVGITFEKLQPHLEEFESAILELQSALEVMKQR